MLSCSHNLFTELVLEVTEGKAGKDSPFLYKASYMVLPYSKAMGEEQSCQMPGSKEEREILARGTNDNHADI